MRRPPTLPPIFHQCPSLKAAHATKTGVMRSEARENLSIVCCVLLRNNEAITSKLPIKNNWLTILKH